MKKILLVLFAFTLVLCGCAKKEEIQQEQPIANAVWDAKEYQTIEELNDVVGSNLVTAAVAGKEDEKFIVISNKIGQYTFKCNGEEWCLRASQDVENDISGLYYDNIGFEKDVVGTYYNDEVYARRFFYNDVQYVISLNVKDKEISTTHFDEICDEFQTNITGVESGTDTELTEDGNNIVYRITIHNQDSTTTIMETIYEFDNDKMVSITSKNIFETEDAAKEYLALMEEAGYSMENITLDATTITSSMNQNLDFYSGLTKEEFYNQMKSSLS